MATDIVFIEGLETEALIGVYAWERRMRQPLRFDLEFEYDNRAPAADDDLELAVDYAEACAEVRRTAEACEYRLLETLLETLATRLLERFPVAVAVSLRVRKPMAARALGSAGVGVAIRRARAGA